MPGQTYYIDPAAGNDANDGLAPARPFKTWAAREFGGGDRVLFKRGSIIREVLNARNGTAHAPVTYGAYGEGALPAVLGSMPAGGDPTRWVEERPGLWRYLGTFPSEVCNLVFNHGESCGNLCWRIGDVRQPGEWHYTGIGQTSAGESGSAQDPHAGVLYLYSPANPGLAYADIECVLWGQRRVVCGQRHLVLENLCFQNSGVHGYQEVQAEHVVIRNCDFRFIGGAVWNRERRIRFGNAVEFWDGASDITVVNCRFDNIYDSAVTHQGGGTRHVPERLQFRNNLFTNCGLAAYECREPSREVYFEHNTCVNTGGGFSMQGENPPRRADPYPQPVGYHVWVWMIDPQTQPGPVYIRHNLFCGSFGAAVCLIVDPADAPKFILDHNAYWQTAGKPLVHVGRGVTNWAETLRGFQAGGEPLVDWSGHTYAPPEFSRYQAECGQDGHSLVAKPLFLDEARGDYRQRNNSPCRAMGMQHATHTP